MKKGRTAHRFVVVKGQMFAVLPQEQMGIGQKKARKKKHQGVMEAVRQK